MSDATEGFGATWLVQSTALLAVGLIAGRLLRGRGPAVQSAVYRTTLAAVLACPAASAILGAMGVAGLALRPADAPDPVLPPAPSAFVPATADVGAVEAYEGEVEFEIASFEPGPPPGLVPRGEEAPPALPFRRAAAVASIWALGAASLLARMAVQQWRVARLRATATDVDPEARALCDGLARGLGVRTPRLGRSPFIPGPCLDGLLRPMILLPEEVDGDGRDAIAHELAHLARRDAWWNLARRLASALLWPQPLAWALSRRLEATAEEVCDDVVVSLGADRARYADLLVATAARGVPALAPAAVGMVSLRSALGRRIARILDASRPLSTRAGRRAVAAVLAVGLAATGFAGLFNVERKAEAGPPAPAAVVAADPPAAAEPGAVEGRVVDEAGVPVAGATVAAWRSVFVDEALQAVPREVARTAADDDGRFRLPAETSKDGVYVVVRAPGFHARVGSARNLLAAGDLVRLWRGEPTPIEGQVVGPDERPLAGARVEVRIAHPVDPTKPTGTLLKMVLGGFGVPGSILPVGPATTDAEGRFRIDGLCGGDGAELRITRPEIPETTRGEVRKLDLGPNVAVRDTDVVLVRPADGIELPLSRFKTSTHDGRAHGLPVRVVTEPARSIEGLVQDAETGAPVAGALVDVSGGSGDTPLTLVGTFITTTDARGHYRIAGIPGGRSTPHALSVYSPTDRPYLAVSSSKIPWREVGETTVLDVGLTRGVMIEGRVVDERGAPVEAMVNYYPLLTNRRADGLPGFSRDSIGVPWGRRHRTDAEGRFRVPGLPGGGVVGVRAADLYGFRPGLGAVGLATTNDGKTLAVYNQVRAADFNAVKAVEIPEGVETFAGGEIRVDRGQVVTLRVVDEAGKPAIGTVVGGTSSQRPGLVTGLPVDENGEVAIQALAHGERREIRIRNHERKLGAFLALSTEDVPKGRPFVVTIRPFGSVAGRFVDGWGDPVAGKMTLWMNAFEVDSPQVGMSTQFADVDAQGRFRIDDLLPGEGYALLTLPAHRTSGRNPPRDVIPPHRLRGGFRYLPIGPVKVEPGRTTDLGTIDVDSGRRVDEPGPAQAPAAKRQARLVRAEVDDGAKVVRAVAAASMLVEGVVRDAGTGEPIPGVAVELLAESRPSGPSVVAATAVDAGGRFRFADVPAPRQAFRLRVRPLADQPYFARDDLKVPAGRDGVATVDVALRKGTWIEGEVVDAADGRPVAARVDYIPRSSNPHAEEYLPLESGVLKITSKIHGDRFRTDASGRFRVLGMPGRGAVVAQADDLDYRVSVGAKAMPVVRDEWADMVAHHARATGAYHALKEVNVPEGPGPLACSLALERGGSIDLEFVDPDGKPIAARVKMGRLPYYAPGSHNPAEPATGARIQALGRGESRVVWVQDDRRGLACVLELPAADSPAGAKRTLKLIPLVPVTGTLVAAGGVPEAGATVLATDELPNFSLPRVQVSAETDDRGRFRLMIPPGRTCRILGVPAGGGVSFKIAQRVRIEPDGPVDLGTAEVPGGHRPKPSPEAR